MTLLYRSLIETQKKRAGTYRWRIPADAQH
jgi:hypothetical protein